jgi:hypothetical protein
VTITYPRELPDGYLAECTFDLMDNVASSSSSKGLVLNRSQVIDPTWKAHIQTIQRNSFDQAVLATWSAWKKSLRGLKTFVAYDRAVPNPIAYLDAKAAMDIKAGWDGTCTVTSLGASGALVLSGAPASYKASVGDRVGLEQDGHSGYYEVLEAVTADVSGVMTLTVAPFLHTTVFTTDALCRLWRPKCQFALDWNSWSDPRTGQPGSISFDAYQVL